MATSGLWQRARSGSTQPDGLYLVLADGFAVPAPNPGVGETAALHRPPLYRAPDFRYFDPPECKKPNRDGWAKCKTYNKIQWLPDL